MGEMKHAQCMRCKVLFRGPHTHHNPGVDVVAATDSKLYTTAAAFRAGEGYAHNRDQATEEEHGVSHGIGPECENENERAWREEYARIRAEREREGKPPKRYTLRGHKRPARPQNM